MKSKFASASTLTVAAISLALAGASPAVAKKKHHPKPKTEKSVCSAKNGCNAAMKGEKGGDAKAPAEPASEPQK